MGHTPYGYRIENGAAVVDKTAAGKLNMLFENYLGGMSLETAAEKAGIGTYHGTVKKLLTAKHYIGDDYYPAIIDTEIFNRVQEELTGRAAALGRLNKVSEPPPIIIRTAFTLGEIKKCYDDAAQQAEYIYSLIE